VFTHHVLQRTVVLADLRVLFLPVPKAGSTSLLWLLAQLAGLPVERFARSTAPEVSPALTVHDMSLWRREHRLAEYDPAERERILTEDGWLRFSLVRHPGTRLWSAWQSKLLLREPRFVEMFGDQPWFPRVPERPADVIEDFRAFVAALGDGGAEDVHWAVQHDLVAQLPLTHVGQVERMPETLALLRAHVGEAWPSDVGRENPTPLPMPAGVFDAGADAVLRERHAADFEVFGYNGLPGGAENWEERVAPLLPAIATTIDEHARIGQLHHAARRAEAPQTSSRAPALRNLEGNPDFDVRWGWAEGEVEPGFTAVLRVKNEARSLPWVLPGLLRAVRRVVLIDNGSTDGTARVARRVAAGAGAAERLELRSYPFAVARCGPEHLATPAASVHSLAHFYNWSFSHVRTAYALKWDGDMVLTDAAVGALRDLAWQLEGSEVVVKVPRSPLYVLDDRHAFLDTALENREPWAWPNRPGYSFAKAMEWELPLWAPDIAMISLPNHSCVELKHLDADEFSHWSPTGFDASARTQRKRREWEVFHACASGAKPPTGVVAIVAPPGRHVIDYVRTTWLPGLTAAERLPVAA
jgi:hypothetical protein